jgi:multiple sugar transport system permease protein/sn-glycerol 3-phosphate transport system permease protein
MTAVERHRLVVAATFVGPALVATVALVYAPMIATAGLSLFDWSALAEQVTFVGLENYRFSVANIDFLAAAANTALYVGVLVPAQIVAPLALALLVLRVKPGPLSNLYRGIFFLPTVLSFPIAAVVWLWLFNPIVGAFNTLLGLVGFAPERWLNDPALAIWCVMAVTFWKCLGLNLVLFLAALVGVPQELIETASLEGASAWQKLRYVTLPLISPTLFFSAVTTLLIVLDEIVGAVDVLTEGGPFNSSSNLLYYLYQRAFRSFQFGDASAVAVVIMAIVALATWLQFRVFERHVHYR